MGPTGNSVKQPEDAVVVFIGGELAVIQLLSFARLLKEKGNRIIFIADQLNPIDLFCLDELAYWCDAIIWSKASVNERGIENIGQWITDLDPVQVIVNYNAITGQSLDQVAQVMVVGPAMLIKSIQNARQQEWKAIFDTKTEFIAAVHGPMQCMLKGVCAQCLQWQIDPKTGERTKAVYACSWHNQPLSLVDSGNLDERLQQNAAQERLGKMWLRHLERLEMSEGSR